MSNPFTKAVQALNIAYEKAPNPSEFSTFTGVGDAARDFETVAKDIPPPKCWRNFFF